MLIQTIISLTGVIALMLALSAHPLRRRWAPYVALPGQPFWLYVTFSWTTWGMFVCSLLYTAVWLHSAWRNWPRQPAANQKRDTLLARFAEIYGRDAIYSQPRVTWSQRLRHLGQQMAAGIRQVGQLGGRQQRLRGSLPVEATLDRAGQHDRAQDIR